MLIIFINMRRHLTHMRMLIKSLFFCLFFAAFFGFTVSAQVCGGNQDDVILKLSGPNNAHGETWNYNPPTAAYTQGICFSQLFPFYSPPSAPHACDTPPGGGTPTNLVLRLSASTNAHGQTPQFTPVGSYIDVCYGGLSCTGRTNCQSGETEVLSLFASNNSHLGTAGTYTTKICCLAPVPKIKEPVWKYFDGSQIPPNTNVCPNTFIIASVKTENIAEGTPITFRFYDRDGTFDDPINALTTTITVTNNQANITINLSERRDILNGFLDDNPPNVELYFRVNISSLSLTNESYDVLYVNNSNQCTFSPPAATVNAPVHRGVYFTNTQINFVSGCTSPMGPVQNEWTITQGSNIITRTEASFLYPGFSNAGQVNVKLKCTDPAGRRSNAEAQMLIVASPYTLAYIEKPAFNELVYRTPPAPPTAYFPEMVDFSARDSFVVDVTAAGCAPTIQCLAGNCPAQTENLPAGCGAGTRPITATAGGVTYSNLKFDWRFWDNDWNENRDNYGSSGTISYNDLSNSLNDKHMSVSVTYTAVPNGPTAAFQRDFTLGRCLNNGNTYYSSIYESYVTTEENDFCKGGDDTPDTADDCCPTAYECTDEESETGQYYCKIMDNPILECEDYTDSASCNGNTNPAIPLASYGQNPPACRFLQCIWDTTTNSCGVRATQYPTNASGACVIGGPINPGDDCAYTTSTTECINGRKTISYNVIAGYTCTNRDPVTVPCGSLSFELPFFGAREFITALLLIAGIYLIFNYRMKRHENHK
jgi:hypothetical protein